MTAPAPPGHNNGPPLRDPLTLDAAQLLTVRLRPSYVQRNCGPGSPLRRIVGIGPLGPVGRILLLRCGHHRELRDYDLIGVQDRRRKPTAARCGLCRLGYLPDPAALAEVRRLDNETGP